MRAFFLVWSLALVAAVGLGACGSEGGKGSWGIPLARDVEVLFESELIFPERDVRQGRQRSHRVADVAIDSTTGDVFVVMERRERSVGGMAASEHSTYEIFVRRGGAGGWETRSLGYPGATGQNHRLVGLAARDGRVLQAVQERDCHLGGCGGQEDGYRVYRFTEIARQKIVGGDPPFFLEVPVAADGWIGGGFVQGWDSERSRPIYASRRVKADSRAVLEEQEGSGWVPGAASVDGKRWAGVVDPGGLWNGEEEYAPSICRTYEGERDCVAPVDWPRVFHGAWAHAFADGSFALVGDAGDSLHLLPFDEELRFDDFVELPGMGTPASARRSSLHPRFGGALPIHDGSHGANHFVRLLDRREGSWEEVVVPTEVCASPPCEASLRPTIEFAKPLGVRDGKEEWLLLLSLRLEGSFHIQGEGQALATRYHLLATTRTVERRPFPELVPGYGLRHFFGPSSAPAGALEAVCHARRSCADEFEDQCPTFWMETDPACPQAAALLHLAASGGGSCEEWLAIPFDDGCRFEPEHDCGRSTGNWSHCEGATRAYCVEFNTDVFHTGLQDCSLLGLECHQEPGKDAACTLPEPPTSHRPLLTDRPVCHLGRYLSWSAAGGRARHWLDCTALGFEGCDQPLRRIDQPRCR